MKSLKPFLFLLILLNCAMLPTVLKAEQDRIYQRIISLYPAHTENLSALGLDRELIGIAASDTYPPGILHKQRFSHRDNAEKFIAAEPDLVLIRPMIARAVPQLISQLERADITVISLQPRSINEMYSYWQKLGKLCGKNQAASLMIQDFKEDLRKIETLTEAIPQEKRPRVYFESIHSKMKTFAPASIALFALQEAGGRNVAADAVARKNSNIAAYGKERILSHAANIDIFLAQQGRMNRVTIQDILVEPGFQAIKAVQKGQIFLVQEELVSRPTQRILLGIQAIKEILYPKQ